MFRDPSDDETLERVLPQPDRPSVRDQFLLETNLGGVDEAGAISPDLDWVGMVAAEFPAQRLQVRSLHPEGLEGAKAS